MAKSNEIISKIAVEDDENEHERHARGS